MTVGNWIEIAFALSIVVQIAPIKIDPWTWIFKRIGKIANEDMDKEIKELSKKLDKHIKDDGEREARRCRELILKYNDDIISGKRFTKEHWQHIVECCGQYDTYCSENKDFRNNVATLAIKNINRVYLECMELNNFL